MVNLEGLGEVISTDVLIVGGSLAGLVTAIKAKERPVDVLIVEKQTTGWAGKPPKTGGFLWVLTPEDNLEEFVAYHVKHMGMYLEDQELLHSYAQETCGAIEEVASWGVKVTVDDKGKLDTFKFLSNKWSAAGISLDMNKVLRNKALKLGVKIQDKIQIVDLLKQGNRVVGAVGFNLLDCRFYVIKAKATVLANGSCNYVVSKMWAAGRGDGIAAAYRAGAEMRNAEFSNWTEIRYKANLNEAIQGQYAVCNAKGELLAKRYNIPPDEPDETITALLAMEQEEREGRGPIRIDLSRMRYDTILVTQNLLNPNWKKLGWLKGSYLYNYNKDMLCDAAGKNPEATAVLVGEVSPIKVDHAMKTTLVGLWAVGDTSWAGSGWVGARPPPGALRGSGLMNAILSARRAGPSVGAFAAQTESTEVDVEQVERLKESIFAPKARDQGVLPMEIVHALHDVVCPFKYQLRRIKNRLEEALAKIQAIKQMLPKLSAIDGHGLCTCNEARSMVLCAEMTFRAALARTESRGWHVREDFPDRDDKNWLKWVILKEENGEMMLSTEPIPIEKYKYKP